VALANLKNITLSLGGPKLLDDVSLIINKGERICLLGRNGVGKSTLLRLLDGELIPDSGELVLKSGTRISRLQQEIPGNLPGTASDVASSGIDYHLADASLTKLGIDPATEFAQMSAGGKRRVMLAKAFASESDMLMLDEPTNHLDIHSIAMLESMIARYSGTIVFVTHDRALLRKTATRIIELDRGKFRDWECNYATFLKRRDADLEAEEKRNAVFDKKLSEEEVWIRKGTRARRTRNEGRVRDLMKLREERRSRRDKLGNANLNLQEAERSGRMVVEAKNLTFNWETQPIVNDFKLRVIRGDRIGLVGPNGCGKSTLIKLLLSELAPQSGTIKLGTNLQTAYFDQQRLQLDENLTAGENVTGGGDYVTIGESRQHIVGYLAEFLFTPDRIHAPITRLSGGERNRLLLAKLFTKPANLLVLDEPTNDLDLETMELLEEKLHEFKGTILLVSHDREFLDNVVTSSLHFIDGNVNECAGGYSDLPLVTKSNAPKIKKGKPIKEKKIKLTYKENKELEELPAKLESLETELAEIHEKMADPELYKSGNNEVAELTDKATELEQSLEIAFTRWEELEEKQSKIEAS
jgi:ABC transport system ATP-binding/permease protein